MLYSFNRWVQPTLAKRGYLLIDNRNKWHNETIEPPCFGKTENFCKHCNKLLLISKLDYNNNITACGHDYIILYSQCSGSGLLNNNIISNRTALSSISLVNYHTYCQSKLLLKGVGTYSFLAHKHAPWNSQMSKHLYFILNMKTLCKSDCVSI